MEGLWQLFFSVKPCIEVRFHYGRDANHSAIGITSPNLFLYQSSHYLSSTCSTTTCYHYLLLYISEHLSQSICHHLSPSVCHYQSIYSVTITIMNVDNITLPTTVDGTRNIMISVYSNSSHHVEPNKFWPPRICICWTIWQWHLCQHYWGTEGIGLHSNQLHWSLLQR